MPELISEQDFKRVYGLVLALWPSELDVSEKRSFSNGGMKIPGLTKVHDEIDECLVKKFSGMDYHSAHAIEFAIFTYFHLMIRETGVTVLKKERANMEKIKDIFNSYEAWQVS